MSMSTMRISVDVVMQRIPLANRWASERWQPAAVVPARAAEGAKAQSSECLGDGPDGTLWRVPGCAIELHPSEAEGYFLNVSAPQPRVFVMWRMVDGPEAPPARPVVVTLSYNEAARMMDGGEQVDSVPLPAPLLEMLSGYVAEHYKPEPRKKVRRNDPFAADASRAGGPIRRGPER
jgi:hypothetical protein